MAKTKNNRTPESEMRIGALQVARAKGGFATTAEVKAEIHNYVELTAEDLEASKTAGGKRKNEPVYYQIVGNVVSHEGSSVSIFQKGYAIRRPDKDGYSITEEGLEYLKRRGV